MTPDNGAYMTAAYVLATLVYGGYVVSLKLRERMSRLESSARPASNRPAGA